MNEWVYTGESESVITIVQCLCNTELWLVSMYNTVLWLAVSLVQCLWENKHWVIPWICLKIVKFSKYPKPILGLILSGGFMETILQRGYWYNIMDAVWRGHQHSGTSNISDLLAPLGIKILLLYEKCFLDILEVWSLFQLGPLPPPLIDFQCKLAQSILDGRWVIYHVPDKLNWQHNF